MAVTDSPEKREALLDLSMYLSRNGDPLKESFKQMIMAYAREIYEKGYEHGRKKNKRRSHEGSNLHHLRDDQRSKPTPGPSRSAGSKKENDMKKKLTIRVAGETGTGKSTVAQAIKDALREYGIEVRIEDERLSLSWFENQEKRLKALGNAGLVVELKTYQVNRVAEE